MTKTNHFHQQLKLHCATCHTIYQLLEIHSGKNDNCPDNCLTKWQELLANHYQEKILFHFSREQEKAVDSEETWAEQLGLKVKKKQ